MRFNSVGFALSVGMALVVVLIGFTLLSAAGLAGFSSQSFASETSPPMAADTLATLPPGSLAAIAPDSLAAPASAEEIAAIVAGDALFKTNCAQCHAMNEVVVGPALAGISKRRPVVWLLPWIKNSSKMVASGDEYAVNIYNKYNKQQMPSFALSDTEIKSILTWVAVQEANGAVTVVVTSR